MKKILLLFITLLSLNPLFASELEDVLKGVLGVIGADRVYIFHVGDKIYSKMGEALYYSGFELQEGQKVLILTYVENGTPIILKFPDPDIIRFKDLRLKIIEFNNEYLKVQQLY